MFAGILDYTRVSGCFISSHHPPTKSLTSLFLESSVCKLTSLSLESLIHNCYKQSAVVSQFLIPCFGKSENMEDFGVSNPLTYADVSTFF
jgi:hypothetical protein